MGQTQLDAVPVVDLCTLRGMIDDGVLLEGSHAAEVRQIAEAAERTGFFQVVGHGVDPDLINRVGKAQRWFFQQPKAVKTQIRRSPTNSRGWFDDELTKQRRDWKECFDLGPEGRVDDVNGFNQWPVAPGANSSEIISPPEYQIFRDTINEYFVAMTDLAKALTRILSLGLQMPAEHFDPYFRDHTSLMRLNYYPICEDPTQHLGISPHKDQAFVTVLAQLDISGLQVYTGDGDGMAPDDPGWVTVEPVAGAFVINVGDLFQVISNDRFKAPLHRVLANNTAVRYSLPFFYQPSLDAVLQPVSSLVDHAHPAVYRPVHFGDMRRQRIAGDIADVGKEVQISDYMI